MQKEENTESFDQHPTIEVINGVRINTRAYTDSAKKILTKDALKLVAHLHRRLDPERMKILAERTVRQRAFDQGSLPQYLDKNSHMVTTDWKVADIPADLKKRRVEITGPASSPKMVINMLSRNSEGLRADCAMLDFEDSMKPSWQNVIQGMHNVIGAVSGHLTHTEPATKTKPEKVYKIDKDDMATVMVRCRGLHLFESNILVDGDPVSAGLFDLAVCFFHTHKTYAKRGLTPKYYIPKCEHHLEARWWNKLFCELQEQLQVPTGTLRATFLIETLTGAFQIEEILYEIKEHAAGLNVGRWDKIFSDIKTLRTHRDRVTGDRAEITMETSWMKNYALRLIEICHARGAFAMGGMAAFTPGKDPLLREKQVAKVKLDKAMENQLGHDGCWVSHPFFIGPALEEFPQDNQLEKRTAFKNKYPDLLPKQIHKRTMAGLRKNIRVGIAYMKGWLQDIGCVAWDNLMEDLATLEISRAQVWQWLYHEVALDDGTPVTESLVKQLFAEELARILEESPRIEAETARWREAAEQASELFLQKEFVDFVSLSSDLA